MNTGIKTEKFPQYFTVVSSSMEPVLKIGDKVTATPVEIDELKAGQVVVYRRDSRYIVHRIVKIEGFVALTAGDNVRKFDAPISVFDIIGVVKNIPVEAAKSKEFRFFRAVKRKIIRFLPISL
ncbi:signal peptidase I [bacterium]|nr:signal peptidase I [bacterium]